MIAARRVDLSLSDLRHIVRRMKELIAEPAASSPVPCDVRAAGVRLKAVREYAGLTQADVGTRLRTTQSAAARIEAWGERLSLRMLRRVSETLGCGVRVVLEQRRGH